MTRQHDEFGRSPPRYIDPDNPELETAAARILRRALMEVEDSALEVDSFWTLFREFVVAHYYGEFVAGVVDEERAAVRSAIRDKEYDALREEAAVAVRSELESDPVAMAEIKANIRRALTDALTRL